MILGCIGMLVFASGCGQKEDGNTAEATNAEVSAQEEGSNENGNESEQAEDAKEADDTEESAQKGYVFLADGVEIAVDMNMKVLEGKLGEPDSYFEEPSCAAQGISKIYTYGSYVIETYPDPSGDLISCIALLDDSVATAEGVDLSMDKDAVIAAYGDVYTEEEGSLTYEKDGMKLHFIFDGDYLVSIEYNSSVLD